MKQMRFLSSMLMMLSVPVCAFLFCGCKNPVIYSQYEVILPEIPSDWQTVLGDPVWRLEWVDESGNWQEITAQQNKSLSLEIINTKINPIIAYPYWPEKNIHPKTFFPAGALFPLDTQNDAISLDWLGGVDAQLFLYLSKYNTEMLRRPEHFDWQRFRGLLRMEIENEEIKANPWIVDWEAAAQRIAQSGFRSSYIREREYTEIEVSIPESALWISPSPFEEGKHWQEGERILLKAAKSPSRYVSAKGTLVFTEKAWAFY
jgi:hypothetical protein